MDRKMITITNAQNFEIGHRSGSDPIMPHKIIPKRVLFVLGTLWGDNGITAHLMTLSKRLIDSGYEVGLVAELASENSEPSEEALWAISRFESQGVKYFRANFSGAGGVFRKTLQAFKTITQLNSAIDRFQPDVLHIHSLAVCPFLVPLRLLRNLPMVSTCHLEPDPNDLRPGIKFAAFVNAHINNRFLGDRLVAVSSDLKDAFINLMNVPSEYVRLVNYGMETEHFRPPTAIERSSARSDYQLSESDNVICLLGRLSYVKGHDVLIEAIRILKNRGIIVVALCAGKGYGKEAEDVQNQIQEAGVGDLVKLLGFTDTQHVLWASDVKVLPSRREAAPLVIQEAMLCGIVPVRTPASGIRDQIRDGIDGFIFPFDDSEALADRLQILFEMPEKRKSMSIEAYKISQEKFSAQRMLEKISEVYQEVIRVNQ